MAKPKLPITRHRRGRGFSYLDRGKPVSAAERRRIEQLAIPPAWRKVRIARASARKVVAQGIDDAGRRQTIYHPTYRQGRQKKKFARLPGFAHGLPTLRAAVAKDLRRRGLGEQKVTAAVVQLLDAQLIRVGNRKSARRNAGFGLTTLRAHHVHANSSSVYLDFVGKSGKRHQLTISDRRLARLIGQLKALGGPQIFCFQDSSGGVHCITSAHVNAYLKQHLGKKYSAKDFRTWGGTVHALNFLIAADDDAFGTTHLSAHMAKEVATRLGNTPAVAKGSYIDPRILALADDAQAIQRLRRRAARMTASEHMSVSELLTAHILAEAD